MTTELRKQTTEKTVTVNGVRLSYLTLGDPAAPPVLFLHGIMGHKREWDTATRILAENHHVHVVEQRGHGDSDRADDYSPSVMADDLIALTEKLGLDKPHLVGHSLGGMVSMVAAGRRPNLFGKVVVIDAVPDTVIGDDAAALAVWIKELASKRYDSIDEAYAEWDTDSLARPDLLRHFVEHCLTTDATGSFRWKFDGGLSGFIQATSEDELWEAVDEITAPFLLITGEHSPYVSASTVEQVMDRLDEGYVVTIAGGAHDLGVQQPEAVARAARAFLTE